MKHLLFIIITLFILSDFNFDFNLIKYKLPEGNLKWSTKKPINAKMCIPAAFTDVDGKILGSYKLNGKSYQNNSRKKISLIKNSFIINNKWQSSNGFQQICLVNNKIPAKFKDSRRCKRRALCKMQSETFILESVFPITMTKFAKLCSQKCDYAIYLDMGEYGYGYIKNNNKINHLHPLSYFTKNKQTNWIYIE